MYGMDLLTSGALNRSLAHIAGFTSLLKARNLVCAGAILRLQLDTALRYYASFLVAEPHEFALRVLAGEHIRKLRDEDDRQLTDAYLVEKLGVEFNWIPRVYERTSGYVHLSATHLMAALSPGESERTVEIKISADDKPLPDWIYVEALAAFSASTQVFLKYVYGWIITKSNPAQDAPTKDDEFDA